LATDYAGVLTIIRYHWYYPSTSDPYYQYNISENMARNNYYGNNYSPHAFVDGYIDAGYNTGVWENLIDQESFVLAPLLIELSGTYDLDTRNGTVNVRIIAEQDPGHSTLRLRIAIIENDINWRAPNGTTVHNQTFRDMIPSTSGQSITLALGDTLDYSFDFSLSTTFEADNCQIVAFVQSDADRNILQGARISIPEMMPSAADDEVMPRSFALEQNYPNPFNAETRIDFATAGGRVSLEIYNITGALVNTLVADNLAAGRHSVIWDGTDLIGRSVSSGVYFYRLKDSSNSEMRKMTLLK
jgi:hypothetical protein